MSEKLTDEQKEQIKALILDGVVENREINERMGLKNTQTMAAIYKIKLDLGIVKKKRKKKEVEEQVQEDPGLTIEDYWKLIVDAKDAHIKDLKEICIALATGKTLVKVGEVQAYVDPKQETRP